MQDSLDNLIGTVECFTDVSENVSPLANVWTKIKEKKLSLDSKKRKIPYSCKCNGPSFVAIKRHAA